MILCTTMDGAAAAAAAADDAVVLKNGFSKTYSPEFGPAAELWKLTFVTWLTDDNDDDDGGADADDETGFL